MRSTVGRDHSEDRNGPRVKGKVVLPTDFAARSPGIIAIDGKVIDGLAGIRLESFTDAGDPWQHWDAPRVSGPRRFKLTLTLFTDQLTLIEPARPGEEPAYDWSDDELPGGPRPAGGPPADPAPDGGPHLLSPDPGRPPAAGGDGPAGTPER